MHSAPAAQLTARSAEREAPARPPVHGALVTPRPVVDSFPVLWPWPVAILTQDNCINMVHVFGDRLGERLMKQLFKYIYIYIRSDNYGTTNNSTEIARYGQLGTPRLTQYEYCKLSLLA